MKYDAFISYRRENGFLMAQVLHDRLKERGYTCFLDLEEERTGDFNVRLVDSIAQSAYFILVLPKNALNRCKDEGDWVRLEILAAVRNHIPIIPVMYDGFSWPKVWHKDIPEEIRQLKYQQGVSMSQAYLSAMIDKIVGYMSDVTPNLPEVTGLPKDTVDVMNTALKHPENMERVCMAFHAGAEWCRETDKVELLLAFMEHKIPVQVILNSPEAADVVCSHMRQPLKDYLSLEECAKKWASRQGQFPGLLQVRISDIPLLHRIYLVQNKDGSGLANVKYYTYGNYRPTKDCRCCFDAQMPEFKLYTEEFDYLWENARVPAE